MCIPEDFLFYFSLNHSLKILEFMEKIGLETHQQTPQRLCNFVTRELTTTNNCILKNNLDGVDR